MDRIDVAFAYRLESEEATGVAGSGALLAIVADAAGWERRIPLEPSTPFAGNVTAVSGTLDLAEIRAGLARLERETGVAPEATTVTIAPDVRVEGTIAGVAFEDTFEPRLTFAIDSTRMALVRPPRPSRASLARQEAGSITRSSPNEIGFLGVRVSVTSARVIAGAVLAATLAALIVATRPQRPVSEAQRIARRYGRVVVPVGPADDGARRVVDVQTVDALVRIAEAHGTLLLHCQEGDADEFRVEVEGTTYRYTAATSAEAATGAASSPVRPGPAVEAR